MDNSQVVFGPPGCGKSAYIIDTMQKCIEFNTPAKKMALVSFTKAASQELASRAGMHKSRASTIHSLAFKTCELTKDRVISKSEIKEYSKSVGIDITMPDLDNLEDCSVGDEYLLLYNQYCAMGEVGQISDFYLSVRRNRPGSMAEFVYFAQSYVIWKRSLGLVDFNDMLHMALFKDYLDLDVLFIDEAQDLSALQWTLINYWSQGIKNVHVVGDDDQSIFAWGGADPLGMAKFRTRNKSKTTHLTKSHRLPQKIHRLSQRLISHISDRQVKGFSCLPEEGVVEIVDENAWTNCIDDTVDTLILFRNHSLRAEIERALMFTGIAYKTSGGKGGPLLSGRAQAIRLWEKIVKSNFKEDISQYEMSVLKGCMKESYRLVFERQEFESLAPLPWHEILFFTDAESIYFRRIHVKYKTFDIDPRVVLSSIHNSKGQEADNVILFNAMGNRTFLNLDLDLDSEIRVFYVGITRAKKKLSIVNGFNGLPILRRLCYQND